MTGDYWDSGILRDPNLSDELPHLDHARVREPRSIKIARVELNVLCKKIPS
jgi:hypothetical protein